MYCFLLGASFTKGNGVIHLFTGSSWYSPFSCHIFSKNFTRFFVSNIDEDSEIASMNGDMEAQ